MAPARKRKSGKHKPGTKRQSGRKVTKKQRAEAVAQAAAIVSQAVLKSALERADVLEAEKAAAVAALESERAAAAAALESQKAAMATLEAEKAAAQEAKDRRTASREAREETKVQEKSGRNASFALPFWIYFHLILETSCASEAPCGLAALCNHCAWCWFPYCMTWFTGAFLGLQECLVPHDVFHRIQGITRCVIVTEGNYRKVCFHSASQMASRGSRVQFPGNAPARAEEPARTARGA